MEIITGGKPSDQRERSSSDSSLPVGEGKGPQSPELQTFEEAADWLFIVLKRDDVRTLMHCVDPALDVTCSTQRKLTTSAMNREVIVVTPAHGDGRAEAKQLADKLRPHAKKVIEWIAPELGNEDTPTLKALDEKYSVDGASGIARILAFERPWRHKDKKPASPSNGKGHVPSTNGNGRHGVLPDGKINYEALTAAELNIQDASAIKIKPIKWVWPYRLAEGEMALVAGEGGLGKSQVMLWIAGAISNGSTWPDRSGMAPKGQVLIVTAEDSAETTIVPRLMAMGANLDNIKIITAPKVMIKQTDKDPLIMVQWLQDVAYWRRACDLYPDLKLLIMDPIVSYLGRGVNDQKNDEVRAVIEPFLDEIIKKRGICFLANTHLNKSLESKNIVHRITGSIAYVNIPRNVHIVFRDTEKPEMRLFAQCKCNNAPDDLPALKYGIERQVIASDGEEIETSKPIFSDELVSPLDLKRIMAAHKDRPGPKPVKLADISLWLFSRLEKGPLTQSTLIDDARDAGHLPPVTEANPKPSKTALYRAVERFSEFVPGWTIVDTTKDTRKAWELAKTGENAPPVERVPF